MPMDLYRKAIHAWERQLAARDRNRVARPFEWGLEWLGERSNGHDPRSAFSRHILAALAQSDEYFGYQRPSDFRCEDGLLKFSSPLATPFAKTTLSMREFCPLRAPGARSSSFRSGTPVRKATLLWDAC